MTTPSSASAEIKRRRIPAARSFLAACLVFATFALLVAPASAQGAPPVDVTITGHGWGHGRGLGQYGALGFATDHGWSSAQILDHYYGDTVAGVVGDSEMSVRLLSRDGQPMTVYLPAGWIATIPTEGGSWTLSPRQAIRITLRPDGTYAIADGDSCAGPFTDRPGTVSAQSLRVVSADVSFAPSTGAPTVAVRPASDPVDNNLLQLCTGATTATLYRGELRASRFEGQQRSVNALPVEQYLRGVVPRESPASWGDLAGGAGMAALQAQAVAARSYALAEARYDYARTCDTTSCQVYAGRATRNGASFTITEDSRTDQAIVSTAGQVRLRAGVVQRTEFSSSTGGYSAGGTFPAVEDVGDSVSSNPNHNWSTSITAASVEAKYGLTGLTSIEVVGRNGLGADGGRVTAVAISFGSTVVVRTGNQFRVDFGLKSDWFSIAYSTQGAPVYGMTETGPFTLLVGYNRAEYDELVRAAAQLQLSPELLQVTGVWVGGFLLKIAPRGYVQQPIRPRPSVTDEYKFAVAWDEKQREAIDMMTKAWDLSPEESTKGGGILLIFLAALARAGR